jgi:hypothetical protein
MRGVILVAAERIIAYSSLYLIYGVFLIRDYSLPLAPGKRYCVTSEDFEGYSKSFRS